MIDSLETLRRDLSDLANAGAACSRAGLVTCRAIINLTAAIDALCEGRKDDAMKLANAARMTIGEE